VSQFRFACFAIALPLHRVFDYRIEADDPALAGTRYRLPFSSGVKTGVLLDTNDASELDPARIKPVQERLDHEAVLGEHMLALAHWMSEYYLQPLGEVVFQCLPGYLRGTRPHEPVRVKRWCLVNSDPTQIAELERRSPRQFEICQALLHQLSGLTAIELKQVNPNWHPVVKALEAKQIVRWEWAEKPAGDGPTDDLPELSSEQEQCLGEIEPRMGRFAVHVLDGITGSGKTEIYLRLIQQRLADGLQVIYLVPEIGLTNQLIERVANRFGDCFVISHSGLTEFQRYQAWDRFRRGVVNIMLGTRSSLFSQCEKLGLIIIDEEHDHSYRQEDGVRYHARDVERDTYFRYRLDQRPTRFPPPAIQLIDVRNSRFEFGCAAQTFTHVERHLAQSGQVLIYLNRRGFAPIVMCHECGWQSLCQNCDARLTLHQSVQTLLCHHCGFSQRIPEVCPDCGHSEIKHYGIGTEQLELGLTQRYPDTPVLRIDRDVIASREALKSRLQQLQSGEPCILIGTQMIAKGHDYPAITLSVVLDADQALFSASYRASERLAQTLFQVSGRSGRGDREGEAILQTRFPDHPLMQALTRQDYRQIANDLLQERRLLGFPPYARVVIFRADAIELKAALRKLEEIRTLLETARRFDALSCVGPMPALMTRRIGRYRAQLCLISQDYQALRSVLQQSMPALEQLASSARVGWSIDVDAYDL
jgi:primosomal protein N' (replication factor Y)